MKELTSHERYKRMFERRDADRVPVMDNPWGATIERWQKEGMPKDVDYVDFFGLEALGGIFVDITPRYEEKTVEETEEYKITTTKWGVTFKNWKHIASTPEYVDFTITDRASWEKAKKRMTPSRDRFNLEELKANYKKWKAAGCWINAHLWFGFDVTHSWTIGTERMLLALAEDPDWCRDMFSHFLETGIALHEMLWAEGLRFDGVTWPDDMGYKGKQFFSLKTYREVLKPYHKRAIDWAHSKGAKAWLHSCGDIRPLIPELVEIGLDGLNPLEVKAGMDPLAIKKQYGDKLVLHGGLNALLYDDIEALEDEMRRIIPPLKQNRGYICSADHSVPSSISLENFRRFVKLAKELGKY